MLSSSPKHITSSASIPASKMEEEDSMPLPERYEEDFQKLYQQTKENFYSEIIDNTKNDTLKSLGVSRRAIEWLENHNNIKEVRRLIDKEYQVAYYIPSKAIALFRAAFKERVQEEPIESRAYNEERDRAWLEAQFSSIKRKLKEEYAALQSQHREALEKEAQSALNKGTSIPHTVWGIPRLIEKDSQQMNDFIYSGSTKAKTVYKPFREIHKALIDANWRLRTGKSESDSPNYITAHLLFTVSDAPHQRDYKGGRTYIDFPIFLPLDLLVTADPSSFTSDESFHDFLYGKLHKIGQNQEAKESGQHSETALAEMLLNPKNLKQIVLILKQKLLAKYGQNEDFKVYEINLFINSNKSICGALDGGCEKTLQSLSLFLPL